MKLVLLSSSNVKRFPFTLEFFVFWFDYLHSHILALTVAEPLGTRTTQKHDAEIGRPHLAEATPLPMWVLSIVTVSMLQPFIHMLPSCSLLRVELNATHIIGDFGLAERIIDVVHLVWFDGLVSC